MELRRDLLIGIGALVAFNVLLSFGTIGLLVRMSPAIERILQENVYSIAAAEEMLAMVARAGAQPMPAGEQPRFAEALQRAESNITEGEEQEVIARIRGSQAAALAGDMAARIVVVDALQELMRINRSAMRAVDREAQRLGTAGAWSIVFTAIAGFALSLAIIRRLRRRILTPLSDLYRTLEAARAGDPYRRCTAVDAPMEIRRIFHAVNRLLDQQQVDELSRQETERAQDIERTALLHLLEQEPAPAFVVDERGQLAAMNSRGLSRLSEDDGEALRLALQRVPSRDQAAGRAPEQATRAQTASAARAPAAPGAPGAARAPGAAGAPGSQAPAMRTVRLNEGSAWLCTLERRPILRMARRKRR